MDNMKNEFYSLGFSFSRKRELATSDEPYTNLTGFYQDMYNKGLLYREKGML